LSFYPPIIATNHAKIIHIHVRVAAINIAVNIILFIILLSKLMCAYMYLFVVFVPVEHHEMSIF
tara:strand:- start:45 stop:236 length:192 start_codon:yes stop_codon:yes gene_type:complete